MKFTPRFSVRAFLILITCVAIFLGLSQHHNRTLRATLDRFQRHGVGFYLTEDVGLPQWAEGKWEGPATINKDEFDFVWLRSPVMAQLDLRHSSKRSIGVGLLILDEDETVAYLQKYVEQLSQFMPTKGITLDVDDELEFPALEEKVHELELLGVKIDRW